MKKRTVPIRVLLAFSTFLLTVLLFIDRACISAAKEEISSDLNFDLTDFGWVMAMFTLGYALFQTPSGVWADKKDPGESGSIPDHHLRIRLRRLYPN